MECQECGKRPATIHLAKIQNGKKEEVHLCEVCAAQKGYFGSQMLEGFISSFLNMDQPLKDTDINNLSGLKCNLCGLTYNELSQVGRLGCSECYKTFGEQIELMLRRIQGSVVHSGKIALRADEKIKIRREIQELRKELEKKVKEEAYEDAALLRDEIKELGKKLD